MRGSWRKGAMMTTYEITARHSARKAWIAMGKAREARTTAVYLSGTGRDVYCQVMTNYTRDMVRVARDYMRLAVLYRQTNEVL
jgi:hypothetical protein